MIGAGMNVLGAELRKRLERTIAGAREVAEAGARAALGALAVHLREPYEHMSAGERSLRRRLRAHGRQLGDRLDRRSGTQSIDRLVHECAYEHWHGMLFARFLEENNLLIAVEWGEIPVSLKDCEELGKDEGLDKWAMAARFAHQMLPQVFRPAHPAFEVQLAREHRRKLEGLVEGLPTDIFTASDSLGWVYQFWQSKKKDEVNRSGDKIGADELPAVTQLFTEPYMVAFLLDNTLGAWWAARRLGDDELSGATDEMELRRKAAIPGVPLDYLRFVRIPLSSSETEGSPRNVVAERTGIHPPVSAHTPPSPSGRGAGGEGKRPPIPADILEYTRTLRNKQTDAEKLLWGLLRGRRFAGRKFRRQHPIGRYILDFYCHECRLAVELDGGQHNDGETKSYDDRRSRFLREQGVRVVRFWNHDVLLQTDSVLESLWHEIHSGSLSSPPSPQTPLPEGEGLASVNLHADTVDYRRSSDPEGEGAMPANLPMRKGIMSAEQGFMWTSAAGRFAGWPDDLAKFRLLDPCCGSGHILVTAFQMLVPMRMELEDLSARDAVDAVLRENLHGLELDPRCVEVAAFALALAAWTYPGAGGYRLLPEMNLACSGQAPNATKEQWTALSGQAAAGLAPRSDLLGVDDTLLSAPLRNSMGALHALFEQAPVLGSLIDPHALEADLFQRDFESIRELFAFVLEQERTSDDQIERAVAARGMARAAELLAGKYTLVITNVPYLKRGKQEHKLRTFCAQRYPVSKNDLATVFLERCLRLRVEGGTAGLVLPQNWLFLTTYRKLRKKLLESETWNLLARLGAGAFGTISGEVVKATLLILSHGDVRQNEEKVRDHMRTAYLMRHLDVSGCRTANDKSASLRQVRTSGRKQQEYLKLPHQVITTDIPEKGRLLANLADYGKGSTTGDGPRFLAYFWEYPTTMAHHVKWLNSPSQRGWSGRTQVCKVPLNDRELNLQKGCRIHGQRIFGRFGSAVSKMSALEPFLYAGEVFDDNVCPISPRDVELNAATWCYVQSDQYRENVRMIDQKLNVTAATLTQVPFDLERWTRVANEQYPKGLPLPYSDDPTQWIFHGHPGGSVVWDETEKRTDHGPLRTDATVLQVAVARLLGYRWPAELDAGMDLADEQREWVQHTQTLLEWTDEDGIVCIPSVRGEPPARDRLLGMLAAAYGDSWGEGILASLLANVDSRSLDDWLRDGFFDEHCKLFYHRPFVWHIWDGRRRDGFHALVSYHKLAAGNGKGRQLLESLTYSYLGDWIARQRDGALRGEEGSEDRLAAACELKKRLEAILEGEPPCDIFVRWKAIHEQPMGWEPDINDGVRLNIRSFMADDIPGGKKGAGILRAKPSISWKKDRGKEALKAARRSRPPWWQDNDEWRDVDEDQALRPRGDYPWFWSCPGESPRAWRTDFLGGPDFDGNRWNDLHYTNAVKSAARARKREWTATGKFTRERIVDVHVAETHEQSVRGRPNS